jgi:hypothetical protein
MATPKVNGAKLKRAIEEFGSLEKAVEGLRNEKLALKKESGQLKQENAKLKLNRDKWLAEVKQLDDRVSHRTRQFEQLSDIVKEYRRQYDLFESFLAMVASSPSVADSLEALISSLRTLLDSGWHSSKGANELRSHFVRTILGDYLKCYGCANCGAAFLVNKKPHYEYFYNYYVCPACHQHSGVKADDSFLKAMVSEKQQENVRLIEQLQQEYDALRPFRVFFDLPCEVCKRLVTGWTEQDLQMGIKGLGWGHGGCWRTSAGQLIQLLRFLEKKWTR